MIHLKELAKRRGEQLEKQTEGNLRVFVTCFCLGQHILVWFLFCFCSPLCPSPLLGYLLQEIMNWANKSWIIVVEGRSCCMSVGLCAGSGGNFMAVLVPGLFLGCDLVPQLPQPGFCGLLSLQPCGRGLSMVPWWMGERGGISPACCTPSEARLPWLAGGQSSARVWKYSPVTPMRCLVCGALKTSSSG